MQEVMKDGTIGETKTAKTLEELIPEIKKSLAKPEVDYVKIFMANQGFKSEEEINRLRAILGQI
jgi:putative NIF3 family GTP cyclohydrolase 1 type 2